MIYILQKNICPKYLEYCIKYLRTRWTKYFLGWFDGTNCIHQLYESASARFCSKLQLMLHQWLPCDCRQISRNNYNIPIGWCSCKSTLLLYLKSLSIDILRNSQIKRNMIDDFLLQLRPTILYTIISKNGELAILDERTYWIMEDQVKQLLSLGKSGILVSKIFQDQLNRWLISIWILKSWWWCLLPY